MNVRANPAEVDGKGFMAQGSGCTLQVSHMPAALGAKNTYSHSQSTLGAREEGALKDFRSDLAEGLASSRLQIMEYDLGRTEKHGIDLIEIVVIALENGGKRLAVVGRSARWHAGADRRNLFIVGPNPDANPAAVQDSIIGPADGLDFLGRHRWQRRGSKSRDHLAQIKFQLIELVQSRLQRASDHLDSPGLARR